MITKLFSQVTRYNINKELGSMLSEIDQNNPNTEEITGDQTAKVFDMKAIENAVETEKRMDAHQTELGRQMRNVLRQWIPDSELIGVEMESIIPYIEARLKFLQYSLENPNAVDLETYRRSKKEYKNKSIDISNQPEGE
jgi:hypothetical protein